MFLLCVKTRGGEGRLANSQEGSQSVRGAKLMKKTSINLCGSLAAHSARASGWITAMKTADIMFSLRAATVR